MDILIRTSHPDTSTTVHVGMRTHTFDTKAAALLAVAMYLEVDCSLVAPPTAKLVEGANLQTHNSESTPCSHEWEYGMFHNICAKCGLVDDA